MNKLQQIGAQTSPVHLEKVWVLNFRQQYSYENTFVTYLLN